MNPKIFLGWINGLSVFVAVIACALQFAAAQHKETVWSADEKPIAGQIHGLRALPDEVRVATTKDLAEKIRKLPSTENKLRLAVDLASLSTEGDFGHDALQAVATTLADTLCERPLPWAASRAAPGKDKSRTDSKATRVPASPYNELASLVRYEHVDASLAGTPLADEQFRAAMAQLEADDLKREHLDFTLKDTTGKAWTFSELRGKVVLVNFWATWCPPCRKEMPDLETLSERFSAKGFVVLGISDEKAAKVGLFVRERRISFPVLLDPGRKVNEMFVVEGIPKTFVYDREGKLVAQSIDMRTQKQFLEMLGKAGLE